MQNVDLILTITGGLAVALVFGYVTHRLHLSPIVGYLLAGIVVGPHTPGFVADAHLAEQLAEVGVILLMFGVGLHFHLDQLLGVRRIALPGAIVQSVAATLLGAIVARAFGGSWTAGIVFGLTLSVASTVVLTRVLADNRELHTPTGHIAVGWLVVEDLLTVFILVVLPAIFGEEANGAGHIVMALAVAIAKVAALVAIVFLVGGRLIPWILEHVALTHSRELFTLTVLVVALGLAVGSAKLFGVSMALGAFLAGMVVGRSDFSLRAASDALPMRDAFAVLFFVSVGMLFDPATIWKSPGFIGATLAVILIGKPLAALAITLLLHYPFKVALSVAIALAQIGEFSFILATLGKDLHILPDSMMHALVAAAIISIGLNPLLFKFADDIDRWAMRQPRLGKWLNRRVRDHMPLTSDADEFTTPEHRAIVVGYGPVGRTVTRLLRENDIEPTVIEMNLDTVRQLRQHGIAAVYGDATHRETLKEADVARAGSLILSSSGMHGSEEAIRIAKELSPDIQVLARSSYVREVEALQKAGAETVIAGEGEVALALTEVILRRLGATMEQIDRERDRVRRELSVSQDA